MQFKELIEHGMELLKGIPKKPQALEQSLKRSGKESQLEILRKDFESKSRKIREKYDSWFKETVSFLGHEDSREFIATKETLSLDLRIQKGIGILKKLSRKSEQEHEKRAISIADGDSEIPDKIRQIIKNGENNKVEFKSSFRWDHDKQEKNKQLELAVGKAICAFLNSEGGIILIGVGDDGKAVGIEKDYPTLRKQDADGFIQYMIQALNNLLGKQVNKFVSASVRKINGMDICIVTVDKSPQPVFIKYDNKEEFYIRASSTSQPLNIREATEYIGMNWG